MTESYNSSLDKRVVFNSAKAQKKFIEDAKKKVGCSWRLFADKIGAHTRTLNDWRRCKYSIPLSVFKKICNISKIKSPHGIEIKESLWWVQKSGKIGGLATYKKYGVLGGDQATRKQKWLKWYEEKGKFNLSKHFTAKKITTPKKSKELSEFVGIMLGDGGITEMQITITLHKTDDKEYSVFVANLIEELFSVKPSINHKKDKEAINIVVSRINLVNFCNSIGLKKGNKVKQQVSIPSWILKNNDFKKTCLRGLIDTDGCIYNECHNIKRKRYCYPRLSFVNNSKPLRVSVFKILKELNFSPKIRGNRSVSLEKRKDIVQYFNTVGTNNPKHIKRFKSFTGGVG